MDTTPPAATRASPSPISGSFFADFLGGARAAFGGFKWPLRDRRVALWTGLAIVVYVGIWTAAMWAAAHWDERVVKLLLWPRGPAWWQSALYEIAQALLYTVYWLAAVVMTFVVALPAVSPIFAFVAEATENAYFGDPIAHASSMSELVRELVLSVGRSLLLVCVHVAGSLTIWMVGFGAGLLFPPAASVVSVTVGGAWSALWIAMATMSWVMENNRAPLAQQLRLLTGQPGLLLGFGLIAQVLAWVPVTAPLVVVSSTVLVCRLNEHGQCALPLRDGHRRSRDSALSNPQVAL